jgi:hypothetical protein
VLSPLSSMSSFASFNHLLLAAVLNPGKSFEKILHAWNLLFSGKVLFSAASLRCSLYLLFRARVSFLARLRE